MKKLFALVITVALLLTSASIAFADESTPATRASVSLDIDGPLVTSPIQKEYIRDVLGVELTDSTVISITDLFVTTAGKREIQGKSIRTVTTLADGTIEVGISVPMVEDGTGKLVNVFTVNPNYLATAASVYATRGNYTSDISDYIPDLSYRIIAYYSSETISSNRVYRLHYAKFKWMREENTSPYRVNRFKLTAAVCGDLYDTSFNLIEEDFEQDKTVDKTNPSIGTYYSTPTVMSSTGNAVTVAGFYQGATLDWDYWVYNRDGSNVYDFGSHAVFGP